MLRRYRFELILILLIICAVVATRFFFFYIILNRILYRKTLSTCSC